MKKIKLFRNFINENYNAEKYLSEGILGKAFNWASELVSKIKNGFFRTIPEGPKKGKPMVAYFSQSEGSVYDQLARHFSDTDYSQMKEEAKSGRTNEAKTSVAGSAASQKGINPFLKYDPNDSDKGPRNVDSDFIVNEIVDRYRSLQDKVKVTKGTREYEETGFAKPIFIFGAPGIGKTEMVAQAADELGVDLLFIDLQFMEPSDLLGVPKVVELASDSEKSPYGAGVTRGNPPTFLPRNNNGKGYENKGGIIFLDEFNRAKPNVLSSMMQFLQQRRIGDYVLPDRWYIVAAGNRPWDSSDERVKKFDPAEFRRVTAFNFVPTVQGFQTHVLGQNPRTGEIVKRSYDHIPTGTFGKPLREIVLPELLLFLDYNQDFFHTLTPDKAENQESYASPAQWIDASKALYSKIRRKKERGDNTISGEEVREIFTDEVGAEAANAFMDFYNEVKNFPYADLEKVYKDPANAPVPTPNDPPAKIWGKIAAAANHIKKVEPENPDGKITPQQLDNAIQWMEKVGASMGSAEYAMIYWTIVTSITPTTDPTKPGKSYLTTNIEYTKKLNRLHSSLFKDYAKFKAQNPDVAPPTP
jgi:hypothetical protein